MRRNLYKGIFIINSVHKLKTINKDNNIYYKSNPDLFNKLNEEFHFNLDPCASADNHKCNRYFTKEQDGLKQNWGATECFAILRMEKK